MTLHSDLRNKDSKNMQNRIQNLVLPLFFIGIAISSTMAEVKEIIEISSFVGIEIDKIENKKYDLFPRHKGFLRAEFLKVGTQYFLAITNEVPEKYIREAQKISVEQFENYRQKIEAEEKKIAKSIQRETTFDKKTAARTLLDRCCQHSHWQFPLYLWHNKAVGSQGKTCNCPGNDDSSDILCGIPRYDTYSQSRLWSISPTTLGGIWWNNVWLCLI